MNRSTHAYLRCAKHTCNARPFEVVRQAGGRDEVCSVRDNMQVHTVRASHAGALRTVVRTVVVCIASDKHTSTLTAHSLAFDDL